MKNWKIMMLVAIPVLLLSSSLKTAIDHTLLLFVLVMALRFIIKFIKVFWKPVLFIFALIYLLT